MTEHEQERRPYAQRANAGLTGMMFLRLQPSLLEWAKAQEGGAPAYIRRLIEEDKRKQERRKRVSG